MRVRITFTEPVLGTCPTDDEIYRNYIASSAPDAPSVAEEIAMLGIEGAAEKGKTVFRKQDGRPVLLGYQVKGFFKDACGMLARVKGTESAKLKAYKKIIDGLIFVDERAVPLEFEGETGECQRPLRAQTAQGEKVSLAYSEEVPAGATATFSITMLDEAAHGNAVREWLDYGRLRGIGQWRNSGRGRFAWELLE
jgi:hypothetical protein